MRTFCEGINNYAIISDKHSRNKGVTGFFSFHCGPGPGTGDDSQITGFSFVVIIENN
jgi:hypothetical protein